MAGIKIWEHIGSDGNFPDQSILRKYAYTQQLIWEKLGQSSATFVNSSHQTEYNTFKNEVNEKMTKMAKRPSFDATEITVNAGETKTLDDNNDVLKDYNSIDVTRDGIRFIHNAGDNYITIEVSSECTMESFKFTDSLAKEVGLIKGETQKQDTTVYIEFGDRCAKPNI